MEGACADQFTVGFRQKMASAKFLEEALSTDVDESAVNAIVGSLETQLVSSTQTGSNQQGQSITVHQNHVNPTISNGARSSSMKHGVSNGGSDSMNIILNSDSNKTGTTEHHNAVNTVSSAIQTGAAAGGYLNQVTSSIGLVQSNITNLNKSQDGVKLVYQANSQPGLGVNVNNVCYTNQSVSLPNGSIGITSNTVLQASSQSLQTIATQSYSQTGSNVSKISGDSGMDQSKPTGTALVIKSGTNSSQGVSPMTTMTLTTNTNALGVTTTTGVPGVVTLAKPLNQVGGGQQTIVGGSSQMLPIINVNTLRPGTSTQPGAKTIPQRVMIGAPQMIGGRPVQPGQITLQALQGLAPGTQGHLLLKTENGQYQLLRVGPATPQASNPTAATAASIPANNANTAAFRVQAVPTATTHASGVQTQVPALSTQTNAAVNSVTPQMRTNDQTKEKCRKFLANLLELSSREPKAVEKNVRTLIQDLVDAKVEPEQFCDRLEKLLNASPQPCLIGFLKKSLPLLRQSMVTKELVIDNIRPPPASVLFATTTTTTTGYTVATSTPSASPMQPAQIRGQVQMSTTPQMRVITHQTNIRPGQQIQHRIITPVRMQTQMSNVKVPTTLPTIRTQGTIVRPNTHIVRTPSGPMITLKPGQTLAKTQFTTRTVISAATQIANTSLSKPSVLLKPPAAKDREKKSFSSGGYTGDDDINDVAAMGGVNLAEETQRILGSTEFVGTQIRSCKDDIYLHSTPLLNKIAQIASKHGLEEPNPDVAALISHATQERLKNLVEKLAVIAEHRIDLNKADPRYEITQDVRAQLKCLEEVDKAERKRHEEQERELLLRAAKSRSKPEDPEQAKLKAKAKEMQRAEMEELRQKEANLTALLAIGPRKKPKLEDSTTSSCSPEGSQALSSSSPRTPMAPRPRVKRVNLRDLLMLMEQEKEMCRSELLYRSYFK